MPVLDMPDLKDITIEADSVCTNFFDYRSPEVKKPKNGIRINHNTDDTLSKKFVEALSLKSENISFRNEVSYINNTKSPIFVKKLDNSTVRLSPRHTYEGMNELWIVESYTFDSVANIKFFKDNVDFLISTYGRKLTMSKNLDNLLKGIELYGEAYQNDLIRVPNRLASLEFRVMRKVSFDNETDIKRSFYISNIGVIVSKDPETSKLLHPESIEGRMAGNKQLNMKSETPSMLIEVNLVDNGKNLSNRYMNVGEKVLTVKPVENKELSSGLYFHNYDPTNPERVYGAEYMPLDQIKEFGLYPSREECETSGRKDLKLEETINQLKKDSYEIRKSAIDEKAKYERESFNLKAEHERDMHRIIEEKERIKREYEEQKMASALHNERAKYAHDMAKMSKEEKASDIKLKSDFLKAGLAVVTAIAGFYALSNKK